MQTLSNTQYLFIVVLSSVVTFFQSVGYRLEDGICNLFEAVERYQTRNIPVNHTVRIIAVYEPAVLIMLNYRRQVQTRDRVNGRFVKTL
jgi:hypothetical protein